MKKETIERLQGFMEHSPVVINSPSPVAGWNVDDVIVCKSCAARIMGRGCKMGTNVYPIWDGQVFCEIH